MNDIAELHAEALRARGRIGASMPARRQHPDTTGEAGDAAHRFIDVLVHGWDLAVGSGQDATLDPVLVEACRQVLEPQVGGFRAAGVFGPEIAVPPDAPAQTRFLAMVGRNG